MRRFIFLAAFLLPCLLLAENVGWPAWYGNPLEKMASEGMLTNGLVYPLPLKKPIPSSNIELLIKTMSGVEASARHPEPTRTLVLGVRNIRSS